jgi:hypothetical protein
MTKNFRVREDGTIAGLSEMPVELAMANLGEGEVLLPFDPSVTPRLHRWSFEDHRWVPADPEPGPEDDYRFWRSTGYPSAGEQLGAIIKLLADPDDPEARREFDALVETIRTIKKSHPKPETA